MRTNFDPSRLARPLLVSLVLLGAVAAPHVASGQSLVKQRPADPVADFQKFLPPIGSVPWLETRTGAAQKTPSSLPEAGTIAAWLMTPRPAATWASAHTQQGVAGSGIVGM